MEFNNICGVFGYADANQISENVLGLFADYYAESYTSSKKMELEFVYDVVKAGMSGKINFNKPFNMQGYEYRIRQNQKLGAYNKRKKESWLDENNDEDSYASGGVQENKLGQLSSALTNDANIDELFEQSEFKTAIGILKNKEVHKALGVDLCVLLKRALQGVPKAISKLQEVCENNALLGEQIRIILNTGKDVCTLV